MIPTLEGSLLRDGRRITFSVTGPRDGLPVLYLHGGAGTPIGSAPGLGDVVEQHGIRHIAVNRPGFGGSDRRPDRTLIDFADDLRAVADELGTHRFAVVGISSGGPYALAAARAMPGRIAALGLVSCLSPNLAPHHSHGLGLSLRVLLGTLGCHPYRAERAAGMLLRAAGRRRPVRHRWPLEDPVDALVHAGKTGIRAMAEDYALVCAPWGFPLTEVTLPVHLWHGAQDGFVPLEQARALARALPDGRLHIGTDDGHFFYRRRMADVLGTLAGLARAEETRAVRPPLPLTAGPRAAEGLALAA